MAEPALSHEDYTVAWICPIEVEQIPAILMLDTEHDPLPQPPNDHNVYTLGSINGHNVVVASLPTAGNCPAATVITQMRNTFRNLRFCLLVGIGGGVPTTTDQGPLRLGHVVVSKPSGTESGVIQCDHGKLEADGQLHRTGVLAPPPPVLLNSAQQMSVRRRMAREDPLIRNLQRVDTSPEMMPEYRYPGKEKDPLYDRETQGVRNRRFEAMDDEGCPKWISVHRGTIATSEKVVKNAELRDRLCKASGAICFEMEAAGTLADFPCLVIRGVSDYADQFKNDDWQPYAAASAAAYARELFFHMPVDQVKQCSIPEKDVKQMMQDTNRLCQIEQDRKIDEWLSPPNPSTNHNAAKERHLEGTGQWFLESTEFSAWKTSMNSALWVHGIPGCGKTILSSTIIQHLHRATKGSSLAYFFFDFSDINKQSFEKMARSLIFQLSSLNKTARGHLNKVYHDCQDGRNQPDLKSLCSTLQRILKEFPDLTVVLDALDECERVSRGLLLRWLGSFECRVLMTSRILEDIQSSIQGWERPVEILSFQKSPVSADIRAYIRQNLGRDMEHALPQLSKKSTLATKWENNGSLLTEIETKLTEKADGMFRWVACQLDALEEYEMPHDLLKALDTLPQTLDETYERILDGIPRIHLSNSTRILQFLTHAERPIKIREAVDILATTPENDPKFDPRNRMPSPQGILKFCSSLVTISEKEIQLAHFSVKEYLASSGEKGPFESNLHEPRAQQSITKVLLAYLSCLGNGNMLSSKVEDVIRSFPLAQYGARYWIDHATKAGKDRGTRESILEFFQHKEAYCICTSRICNPEPKDLTHFLGLGVQEFLPLYLASMSGWEHIVQDLLSQDSDSINKTCKGQYGTALWAACKYHQMDVVKILLERGADVNQVSGDAMYNEYSTALMTALTGGHNDLAELLLKYDVDLNVEVTCPIEAIFPAYSFEISHVGTSPLIWASLKNSEDWARTFLNRGALPNKTDDWGNSALYYACWRGYYKIVNMLLSHGADIYGSNCYGETPLHAACESGCDEVIRLLLEKGRAKGSGTLVSGRKYRDALQAASFWGRLDAVNVLLSHGADPNHTESDYGPALHAASSRGHLRVVELLLNRGADPHILDCHQWTALFLAVKNGHDDIGKALWHVSADGPLFRCFYPSTFVKIKENHDIKVSVSERILEKGAKSNWVFTHVRSDHPFVATARKIWFQIKILRSQRKWETKNYAEIGLCCIELHPSVQTRFGPMSCHSALRTGRFSRLKSILSEESARWQSFHWLKQGDIIGCGVDYDSNTSFFTLNGKVYGKSIKKDIKGLLLPEVRSSLRKATPLALLLGGFLLSSASSPTCEFSMISRLGLPMDRNSPHIFQTKAQIGRWIKMIQILDRRWTRSPASSKGPS